jgi:type I restriction enzyme S subunit
MASEYVDDGIPFLRSLNVAPFGINTSDLKFVSSEFHQRIKKSALRPGDVVIVRTGKPGTCAVIPEWLNDANCSDLVIARCGAEIRPRFLCYWINSAAAHHISSHLVGAVQQHFNVGAAKKMLVATPSLFAQDQVISILGSIDDRITLLRETNATLEAIAQALFKSWFVDFDPVRAKAEGLEPQAMDAPTAALFPDSFEEFELGLVPKGWVVAKFGDFINRLSVGQKYDQKSAFSEGNVPVLDQGKSGIIGYHNDSPGVKASLEEPVVVFANHTCYMRLITFDFSAIQNVLPFNGRDVDTVWAFYATKDRVKFSEYKGHWPDFAIEKSVLPPTALTFAFRDVVDPMMRKIRFNELQAQTLTQLRDTLLPRLISGQLRLPEAEALFEGAL